MSIGNHLQFKTILVATDLSQFGECALRCAQGIARSHGAILVVVHVVDPVGYAFPEGLPDSLTADQAARNELFRMEEETRRQGIPIHSVLETGVVYERILQAIVDHHADLLVLGTGANTEIGRAALGTVARRLLAKAPCPVLTVPPEAIDHLQSAGRWRQILVATDFSPASLVALNHAQSIVESQLVVIHVASQGGDRHLERLRFLAPFNESHTAPVEHVVAPGEAGKVIAEYARRLNSDLVVLGSPLDELQGSDFQTSTVLQVISNVDCPVLCVPSWKTPFAGEDVRGVGLSA